MNPGARSKIYRILKWGLIGTICAFIVLSVAIGLLAAPDLSREIPVPEVVHKIAEEKRLIEQKSDRQIHLTTTTLARDSITTSGEPFIPDLPNPPKALKSQRSKLNDDYSSITRALEKFRADTPGLSYEESLRRCEDLRESVERFVNHVFPENYWTDENETLRLDPAFKTVTRKCADHINAVHKMNFEILVRHEKWDLCAYCCENDLYNLWPEAIYYWRRHGGWRGYYQIIGGALYVRSVNYPLFDRVRNWLPYNASAHSPEMKREMMKDREFFERIKFHPYN